MTVVSIFLIGWSFFAPEQAAAQAVFGVSRDSTVTFDVFAGATSQIDRLRVVDGMDTFADFPFHADYMAYDASSDGAGSASGVLDLTEVISAAGNSIVIDVYRSSSGAANSIVGIGVGSAQLNNTYNLYFDVIGPFNFELTAYLENDPLGNYAGSILFDDTSLVVPPILSESSTIAPVVISGTLASGTYRLRAVMSGTVFANASSQGPVTGLGNYGMTLELFVPEPGFSALLGSGILGILALVGFRSSVVSH